MTIVFSYSQEAELKEQIAQILRYDTQVDFNNTPGILVSVIDGDSIWHLSFGKSSFDSDNKLRETDIFEFASITKVFTSSLIDILVTKGIMDFDSFVNYYLPEEYQNPRLDSLKISDLINHNSQLPRRPSFFGKTEKDPQNPYEYYTTNQLLEFYRDYIPDMEDFFVYSHTNYALLEYIIEQATDKNYGDCINEYLFLPLNMQNSFIDFKEKRDLVVTTGYDRAKRTTKPWSFTSFKASESLKSTNEDMCKFIKANLSISNTNLDSLFSNNFESKNISFNDRLFISMGWHIIKAKDLNIITHTGKTSGHTTFIGFVRETNTGVVVSSNSAFGSEDLGMLVLRMLNFNWNRNFK